MAKPDWYNGILNRDGPPAQATKADAAYAETWRGRVPDWLIRQWTEQGWGSWYDGNFWTCDPAWSQPVAEALFEGDPLIDPERAVLFAYEAFGNIYGYHPDVGAFDVDWNVFDAVGIREEHNRPRRNKEGELRTPDQRFAGAFGSYFSTAADSTWTDEGDEPMLPQAIARLGRLEPGEIYGFFPALKLGGENDVANLQRVPAIEHWLFLASLGRLNLHEYYTADPDDIFSRTSRVLRRLGPQ